MIFLATYLNVKLCFFAGTIQLIVHSKTVYLVLPAAKVQIVGHFNFISLPSQLKYNGTPNCTPILSTRIF